MKLTCTNCKKERDLLSNGICNPCQFFRAHFDHLIRDDLIEWLQQASEKVYVKMTDEEIVGIQGGLCGVNEKGKYGMLLPKLILCTIAADIEMRFGSEGAKKQLKQVKKIHKSRY